MHVRARWLTDEELTENRPRGIKLLYVADADHLSEEARAGLSKWMSKGGRCVFLGRCEEFLSRRQRRDLGEPKPWPNAYVSFGPTEGFGMPFGRWPLMFRAGRVLDECPPGVRSAGALRSWGEGGVKASAILYGPRWAWCPVPFLSDVSAVLQGAVSPAPLKPFLGRDLSFWIDGVASILGHLARFAGSKHLSRSASPWEEGGARILLRHDTDWSDDRTYLELEDRRKIPSTYAILPDRRFDTWLDRLGRRPSVETALHYSLHVNERARPGVFDSLRRMVQGVRSLEAQCKDFERRAGRVSTVHRHLGTFAYPQDVEQLFRAERAIPTLTGSCTMFRFKETRVFGVDADRGSIEHPDTNISLWFPYKLVRATVDGLEFLSGWESGAFVEPSAAVVTGLLRHARRFPGGVYPVIFHPAHARSSVLAKGGMQTVFARLVDSARRRGIGFDTFERTYASLNEWDPNP